MPSQTAAGTLINLWILDAPWAYPTWQEITGIYHGLFPEDDAFLPKTWSRRDAQDVESFFEQYKTCSTEAERVKFIRQSRGAVLPGRAIWLKFITKGWNKWRIHSRIINQLEIHNIHPLKLMLAEGNVTKWPCSSLYLPEALDDIGVDLFGPEALLASNRLPTAIKECVRMLAQQTWLHIRKQVERSRTKIDVLEKGALHLVSGLSPCFAVCHSFQLICFRVEALEQPSATKAKVQKAIRAVGKWRDMTEILCTEENLEKVNSILSKLNDKLETFGVHKSTKNRKESATGAFFFYGQKRFIFSVSSDSSFNSPCYRTRHSGSGQVVFGIFRHST